MHNRVGERGVTLLDVVVGSALMIIVFTGFTGAFRLAVETVGNNKARAGAIALTNERLEYIRSLPYNSIGTVGGIPAGALEQSTTTKLNDITYTRRTFVSYEDDPGDGTGGADSNGIVVDYKAAKVSVSWDSRQGTRTLTMTTRISPPTGIESAVPGGTIAVQVTDDADAPVANAQVRIVNAGVVPAVDFATFTDDAGAATVLGAPAGAGYQVTVSKAGYSTSQTYSATATNTNPLPAHLGVALNQTTAASFEIDILSTKIVQSYVPVAQGTSTDSFTTESGVASSTNVAVVSGLVRLTGNDPYEPSGTILSMPFATSSLVRWGQFTWDDSEPAQTEIRYRVYDGSGAVLIPEEQLPGNEDGFTSAPVNLSAVSTSSFGALSILAMLSSADASTTPSIYAWSISMDSGPKPLPNLAFTLQGTKTVGAGPGGPVYKYSASHSTGAGGSVSLSGIEYDAYTMSVAASTGYDISSSCATQPVSVAPGVSVATSLIVSPHTTNSLLVDVKTPGGAVIPNASVRLYRSPYDATKPSDECGQAFFSSLSTGSVGGGNPYSIEVSATGYVTYTSAEVSVSGTTRLSIILN